MAKQCRNGFVAFQALVTEQGWTLGQLRCDAPPTEELLEAMDRIGLATWEKYVLRWERESQ
jgi:hypothetical protein